MFSPVTINKIQKLIEKQTMSLTGLGKVSRKELQPFIESGALRIKSAGGGRRVEVVHLEVLQKSLEEYPYLNNDLSMPARGQKTVKYRNSKLAKPEAPSVILLKSIGKDTWINEDEIMDVSELSQKYGVAALAIASFDQWKSSTPLALIENKEPFFFQKDFYSRFYCTQAAYYQGQLSQELIDWLAKGRVPKIYFFPDFDPVGMENFLKLNSVVGLEVELVLPEDLEKKFSECGKRELLTKQQDSLKRVQNYLKEKPNKQISEIFSLIHQYGGLEQEALYC